MIKQTFLQEHRESLHKESVEKAYEQADIRMTDLLDIFKGLQDRASFLMRAACAILLAGGVLILKSESLDTATLEPLTYASMCLIACIACCMTATQIGTYYTKGASPEAWMREDFINGDDTQYTLNMAYLTYNMQSHIDRAIRNNALKWHWLRCGYVLFFIACVFVSSLIWFPYFFGGLGA